MHETRLRRHGTTDVKPGCQIAAAERFELYVDRSEGCWLWRGTIGAGGYGQIRVDGVKIQAHRFSYEHHRGPIPTGLHVMHSCDNPPCVNPEHLSVGSRSDNMRDMASKRRGNAHHNDQRHPSARLTDAQVAEIRRLAVRGIPRRDIARQFGVSESHTGNLITRRSKRA